VSSLRRQVVMPMTGGMAGDDNAPEQLAFLQHVREPRCRRLRQLVRGSEFLKYTEVLMGSLVKKRRKKMSKHKYRKRLKANRHKRKK
jgi:hypothetical protein